MPDTAPLQRGNKSPRSFRLSGSGHVSRHEWGRAEGRFRTKEKKNILFRRWWRSRGTNGSVYVFLQPCTLGAPLHRSSAAVFSQFLPQTLVIQQLLAPHICHIVSKMGHTRSLPPSPAVHPHLSANHDVRCVHLLLLLLTISHSLPSQGHALINTSGLMSFSWYMHSPTPPVLWHTHTHPDPTCAAM